MRRISSSLALLFLSSALAFEAQAYEFDAVESAHQASYLATSVALNGRVVDELGAPIEGAQLSLVAWGENLDNDGEAALSWSDGSFSFPSLARRNAQVEISAEGYYSEVLPLNLQVGLDETSIDLDDIVLTAKQFGRARLSFGGDVMFDRRMYDEGVLDPASFGADTRALFQYVEGLLQADDHSNINLETPVTDEFDGIEDTPHPVKSYVFGAHPDTVFELPGLGVDSVALGNNHIFDYMTQGVVDTLAHLDNIGLMHMGAGMSRSDARASLQRPDINGIGFTLQSFSNSMGTSYGGEELHNIAHNSPDKAGAMASYNHEIDRFNDDEAGLGRFVIPIIHGGTEYAVVQSSGTRNDFERFIEGGSDLIIAHHPHVAHGVSIIQTLDGPKYIFGSLGNLVFDQDIYETMRSYLAVIDVADMGNGPEVERIRLAPYRIDEYSPRLMAGEALEQFGRTLAHYGTAGTAVNGFDRAVIFAENGQLVVAENEDAITTTDLPDARVVGVSGGSTGVVSLERYTGTDALAELTSDAPASCELGRDLLAIGSFEELDVDDSYAEDGHWKTSSHRYLQGAETHSGQGAAVLLRTSSNSGRTSLYLDKNVEVFGGHHMTIRGWHKGNNAGEFEVRVRWLRSGKSSIYETAYQTFDGDFDWSPFSADVVVPEDAQDIKVYFRHYPPEGGDEAELFLDDLEFIDWDPSPVAVDAQGSQLATPNAWDYVRCAAEDGDLGLTLTHRVYENWL